MIIIALVACVLALLAIPLRSRSPQWTGPVMTAVLLLLSGRVMLFLLRGELSTFGIATLVVSGALLVGLAVSLFNNRFTAFLAYGWIATAIPIGLSLLAITGDDGFGAEQLLWVITMLLSLVAVVPTILELRKEELV